MQRVLKGSNVTTCVLSAPRSAGSGITALKESLDGHGSVKPARTAGRVLLSE